MAHNEPPRRLCRDQPHHVDAATSWSLPPFVTRAPTLCPLLAESCTRTNLSIFAPNWGPRYPPSSLGVSQTSPANDDTVEQRDTGRDWSHLTLSATPPPSIYRYSNTPSIPNRHGLQIQALGPPHLQIYRAVLPFDAAPIFARLVAACEAHASRRRCRRTRALARSRHDPLAVSDCSGWETNLYSLTKQDMAVADVPGGLELVAGIQDHVQAMIRHVYRHQGALYLDRNQPHVLKYDSSSSGDGPSAVPLHHDRCHGTFLGRHEKTTSIMLLLLALGGSLYSFLSRTRAFTNHYYRNFFMYIAVTVNMMMSASDDYVGGGTYFVDLQQRIVLERGEFLLHPGHAIHAGCEITAGTRYLLVSFVHFV
jgi:hypothetical protein